MLLGALALWFLTPGPQARAHVPNIATFVLSEAATAGSPWRLEVHMATGGMHAALSARFPGERLSTIEPLDYQARLESLLRDGISLRYVDTTSPMGVEYSRVAELGPSAIEIGAHTSVVVFDVVAPPQPVQRVQAHVRALSVRGGQQNVFRLVTARGQRHVVLSDSNQFSGELSLGPEGAAPEPASAQGGIPVGSQAVAQNLAGDEAAQAAQTASPAMSSPSAVALLFLGGFWAFVRRRRHPVG